MICDAMERLWSLCVKSHGRVMCSAFLQGGCVCLAWFLFVGDC